MCLSVLRIVGIVTSTLRKHKSLRPHKLKSLFIVSKLLVSMKEGRHYSFKNEMQAYVVSVVVLLLGATRAEARESLTTFNI